MPGRPWPDAAWASGERSGPGYLGVVSRRDGISSRESAGEFGIKEGRTRGLQRGAEKRGTRRGDSEEASSR